ncbi:MAG: gamma-glutamylcyclotransferase [Sphingomonadales bacterium]|nr:gamma-glutamylcyclotransferase [Sphingomonadales bacterium]
MAPRARDADLFFFYGTLVAGGHPAAAGVHRRLRPLGAATTAGMLLAIADPAGWYPALVPGVGTVHGKLYAALPGFTPADLAVLDRYEGYRAEEPAGSDYVRRRTPVRDAGGQPRRALAYWWNRPAGDAPGIAGGDFAGWLARHGRDAFGG